MSKFQPPMLNDDVCRARTDKQTHKHIHKQAQRRAAAETVARKPIEHFIHSINY